MATESQASGAEYAADAAFPPFDPTYFASQLFWAALSFFALYIILSRFVLPRIGGAIEERRDRIADDLDTAAQMKAQADETVATYEKSLADARAKAHAVAAEAKAVADAEIAEATRDADAELDAKLDAAEVKIREARDAALGEVRTIASAAAIAAASRLADLDVSDADAAKAVDKARE